jgi:hypothetical protein
VTRAYVPRQVYTGRFGLDWLVVAGQTIGCAADEVWDFGHCRRCVAGTQPEFGHCKPCPPRSAGADSVCSREKEIGSSGGSLEPLGLFLRTSIQVIWCILSAFLHA